VLVLSDRSVCWSRPAHLDVALKQALAQHDITLHEDNAYYHELTLDRLSQYQAVIMLYPPTSAKSSEAKTYLQKGEIILDYVRSGGGLLVLADQQYDSLRPLNELLQSVDAAVLPESVTDDTTRFRQDRFFREYFFTTTNFAPHPVTEGLKALCLPSAWHAWKSGATGAPQVGADWQVVVRGNTTARSIGWRADVDGETTYESAPPIMAVRALDAGRIALLPTRSVTTIQSGHHFVFESLCYERGDLTRLVANTLQWLSEPSRESGGPGGYVEPPQQPAQRPEHSPQELAKMDPYTRLGAIGFREGRALPEHTYRPRKDFVGVIGIYSDFSRRVDTPIVAGGYGTVAEYCRRAKGLGCDFIAFTERFEAMNPEKWDQLVAQCRANSDDTFLAIPGIEIQDVHGDRFACLDLPGWPQEDWLDPTGRYILDHPAFYFGLSHKQTVFLGRFLLTPRQGHIPPWFHKFYAGMSLFDYKRGDQPAGEALDWYRTCQANDYNLIPIVSHGISSPRDLAGVTGYRVRVLADAVADVPKAFRYGWYTPRDVYVSSGPRIEEWAIENGRSAFREEPWRLFVRVSADVPIKRITIWDGDRVFRRYYPHKEHFSAQVTGYHDRQRFFLLTAEDEAGGRLVSSALYTSDVRHSTYMCTDLQNTINSMVDVSRSGKQAYFRVQGLYVTCWDSLDVPALVSDKDVLPESGIEYGLAPMVGAAGPVIHTTTGTEHSVAQRLMAFNCGDVNILDNRYAWTLLPGSYVARTSAADAMVRLVSFTPRAYGQNVMLIEHTVTIKRDVVLGDRPGPEIVLLQMNTGATKSDARAMLSAASEGFPQMCAVSPAGERRVWQERPEPIDLDLQVGGYAAFYPNFWGSLAVYPLTEGLVLRTGDTTQIGLSRPSETLKAGTVLTARALVVRGAFGQTGSEEFDTLRDTLGLDGSTAYTPKVARGELLDTRYILRLKAQEGAAALTTDTTPVAAPVPLVVEGLKESCDAVALDTSTQKLRRVATFEGAGWLTVDPASGPISLIVGNAVDCDAEQLHLSLLGDDEGYLVEAHNPTGQAVTASLRVPDWLAGVVGKLDESITLAPGETRSLRPSI